MGEIKLVLLAGIFVFSSCVSSTAYTMEKEYWEYSGSFGENDLPNGQGDGTWDSAKQACNVRADCDMVVWNGSHYWLKTFAIRYDGAAGEEEVRDLYVINPIDGSSELFHEKWVTGNNFHYGAYGDRPVNDCQGLADKRKRTLIMLETHSSWWSVYERRLTPSGFWCMSTQGSSPWRTAINITHLRLNSMVSAAYPKKYRYAYDFAAAAKSSRFDFPNDKVVSSTQMLTGGPERQGQYVKNGIRLNRQKDDLCASCHRYIKWFDWRHWSHRDSGGGNYNPLN